jgi:NADH dehydrogenase
MKKTLHAVTGAFGYSGKYFAKHLLDRGHEVVTLTNSPDRASPFARRVNPCPFNFDNPKELTRSTAVTCPVTHWIRWATKGGLWKQYPP